VLSGFDSNLETRQKPQGFEYALSVPLPLAAAALAIHAVKADHKI
jgi:hypothetical protein